jgi:hypothetical protein
MPDIDWLHDPRPMRDLLEEDRRAKDLADVKSPRFLRLLRVARAEGILIESLRAIDQDVAPH